MNKHVIASGFVFCLLGSSLLAQTLPQIFPLQEIRRAIPPTVGDASAVSVVSWDPDGDMLHDLGILGANGHVTFGYAPEILSAFVDCPVTGATGIARIPGGVAMPGSGGHDALLIATGSTLGYLTFDCAVAWSSPTSTGLTLTPMTASTAWQQAVKVETFMVGSTCWVLGLAADQQTIHAGVLDAGGITHCWTVMAGSDVQQLLAADFQKNGLPQIVARTSAGLQMWSLQGSLQCTLSAPTSGAAGAFAKCNVGPVQQVAWVVQSGTQWLLRVYLGSLLVQESTITASGWMPNRFHPVSIGAIAIDTSGTDALVLHQNSTEYQLVLVKRTNGYEPACVFKSTGITYPTDACPASLVDMNNDGNCDFTTVLSSPRCVQIDTGLALPIRSLLQQDPPGSDSPDYLPVECWLRAESEDAVNLRVAVPPGSPSSNLEAQVVSWLQPVAYPHGDGPVDNPYGTTPIGGAASNLLFALHDDVGLQILHPMLLLPLVSQTPGQWDLNHQYDILVRLIQRSGSTVTWSSPAQLVGFVAGPPDTLDNTLDPADLAFMNSISSGGGPYPQIQVHGNRNVGAIPKPPHMDPPGSTIKVPAVGPNSSQQAGGPW